MTKEVVEVLINDFNYFHSQYIGKTVLKFLVPQAIYGIFFK